jgi:ATP-dependent DNA ligase
MLKANTYTAGRVNEQEFVIGGYTDPKGSRVGFGALLVGYYKGKQFKYAGMVGTGYDDELLRDLGKKLRKIEKDDPPFSKDSLPKKNVHRVKPKLVEQVGFTEWTGDGKLRHACFKGLRPDKTPKDVVREKQ